MNGPRRSDSNLLSRQLAQQMPFTWTQLHVTDLTSSCARLAASMFPNMSCDYCSSAALSLAGPSPLPVEKQVLPRNGCSRILSHLQILDPARTRAH